MWQNCIASMHFLIILAPAGVLLVTAESGDRWPQFCTQTNYRVVEGDQQAKLCMQLLGPGGTVNADLTVLDGTAGGVSDTYIQLCQTALKLTGGMGVHVSGRVSKQFFLIMQILCHSAIVAICMVFNGMLNYVCG